MVAACGECPYSLQPVNQEFTNLHARHMGISGLLFLVRSAEHRDSS